MKLSKIMSKLLLKSRPVIEWIDRTFTKEYAIKKVNGDHYYLWRSRLKKGMVLLSNINGVGSNVINPSSVNHSAIYFGRGLNSYIMSRVKQLEESLGGMSDPERVKVTKEKVKRLVDIAEKYGVRDDIYYVIEAVGEGVIPTNLVKFLTTKDLVKIYSPKFTVGGMSDAANLAVDDLGLKYDFAFSYDNDKKYCFEVVGNAYENATGEILQRVYYKIFGIEIFVAFLSETFTDDADRWECVIDSTKSA